jgi:hypothetical protein
VELSEDCAGLRAHVLDKTTACPSGPGKGPKAYLLLPTLWLLLVADAMPLDTVPVAPGLSDETDAEPSCKAG